MTEMIFHTVRACVAMHNMMVKVHVGEDQEENSSFYEVTEERPQEKVVDRAEREIAEEDVYFANNAELANLDNDVVDLAFKEKMEKVSFKTRTSRLAQRRFSTLHGMYILLRVEFPIRTIIRYKCDDVSVLVSNIIVNPFINVPVIFLHLARVILTPVNDIDMLILGELVLSFQQGRGIAILRISHWTGLTCRFL